MIHGRNQLHERAVFRIAPHELALVLVGVAHDHNRNIGIGGYRGVAVAMHHRDSVQGSSQAGQQGYRIRRLGDVARSGVAQVGYCGQRAYHRNRAQAVGVERQDAVVAK